MIGNALAVSQDMSAAIIRIRYALDEAARLQPVEQANERNWPDVENSSEGGLIGPFVLRQLYEDSASSESHVWEVGAQRPVVATASQPGCLEQQPHNHIWIIRARIILGPRRRLRGRGLLRLDGGRSFRLSGQVWETSFPWARNSILWRPAWNLLQHSESLHL
jgi:hypothetical protein